MVGDGADSIAKAAGGWTLSWQGGTHTNEEFPNGETILSGIEEVVSARGGKVIYDPTGTSTQDADVIIAVYGENAYAEFQGDRENLDFQTDDFDTTRLEAFQKRDIPVVSVFLSGRPMWTTPEINDSDAFVAAWLPGSEGHGIADVLFQTKPEHVFKGKLSFSWPKTAVQGPLNTGADNYDPLFAYGYGLSYSDSKNLGSFAENSGIKESAGRNTDVMFTGGQARQPWSLYGVVAGTQTRMTDNSWDGGKLVISGTDRLAQEDSLRIDWHETGPEVRLATQERVDLSRQSNGAMELAFHVKTFDKPAKLNVSMTCNAGDNCQGTGTVPLSVTSSEWTPVRISLKCFEERGVDMSYVQEVLRVGSETSASIGISDIRLEADIDAKKTCGDL